MSYTYGVCCVPFLFSKNHFSKILFSNPFPIKRSVCESQRSGFGSDPKNPPWVWILWIHDPFLDSEIRIWIFPKNTPYFNWPLMPQLHLQNSKEFLAVVDESRANKHKHKKVIKSLPFWNKLYTLTVCDYMISDVSWGTRFWIQLNLNLMEQNLDFNEILVTTNTIHKHKYKIYLNITNKCQHVIKHEYQTDQQG